MGMQNPKLNDPIDKLSEIYPEGTRFFLEEIRVVPVRNTEYGDGEMVIIKVRGHERELGVWGSYLLTQAKSVDLNDLHRWYKIERRSVEGFGKGRPVKMFVPAGSEDAPGQDDDVPFDSGVFEAVDQSDDDHDF